MIGKKLKEKVKLTLLNIGFILLCFLTLIPILYAFSISISGSNSIISTEFHVLPKTITMDNYITILTERPFGRWFANSLLLSVLTVLLTMLVAVPAAYVFSRMRFAGRKRTLHILLVLNAFPAILSMFAIYRIIKIMNLLNSYIGLVFIYANIVFRLAIVGKSGYMFKTISLIILAVAMMLGIDYVTGYRGWSLDFVVPSAILVVDLVIFLLILINRRNWQSYMMTEILTILLSLIPVILRLMGMIHFKYLVWIAFGTSLFLFLGTLILGDQRARTELKRRFHV